MSITTQTFNILDQKTTCLQIRHRRILNSDNAMDLRETLNSYLNSPYPAIYLDVKDVFEMDLAGVNEIINAHYSLQQASKKLVLVYRKNSVVEGWVKTTALDRFIETAFVA